MEEPLLSDEKPPRDNPTAEVAVADRAPELVEAEALALAAVALALVAVALAVKTTSWLGVTAAGWNALSEGSDAPPADGVTPPAETAPPREKTERLSEPSLLTRTSNSPLALATTSIELGKAGVAPSRQQLRLHDQAVALWHQEIDDAVGEGHHDLPARQGLRGHAPAGRSTRRWRRRRGRRGRTAPGLPPAVTA